MMSGWFILTGNQFIFVSPDSKPFHIFEIKGFQLLTYFTKGFIWNEFFLDPPLLTTEYSCKNYLAQWYKSAFMKMLRCTRFTRKNIFKKITTVLKKMILPLGCFSVFDFKTDTTLRYELLYSFVVLCLSSKIKIEWILNQLELTQILICAWWRVLSRY